jgi:serine/threonine protein kinase
MAEIPEKIGKYRVLGLLGRGGMGAVYKAEDVSIGRLVAIKVLLTSFDNEDMLKRFFSEARSNGKLQHPNIVTLYDLGDMDGAPYLVMQFLDGESLDKVIASDRQINLLEAAIIVRQVCSALHFAHENDIIHRDVKPGNVVLMPDGNVKLVDFGIARYGNERQTRTGMAVGSVNYMSPEQISGTNVDRRTDVYSTGVLLYELLTRQLPFAGTDIVSTINKVLNAPIPDIAESIPDASDKLREVVATALAKDPAARYQTAEDMSDDLLALQEQLQQTVIHERIHLVKEAIIARDWELASDRLSHLRRIDLQNREARELSREIRTFSNSSSTEEKIRSVTELVTQAEAQQRFEDVLRLCALGLEIDPENPLLLQLREKAQKSAATAPAPELPVQIAGSVPGLKRAGTAPVLLEPALAGKPTTRVSAEVPLRTSEPALGIASSEKQVSRSRTYVAAAFALVVISVAGGWFAFRGKSHDQSTVVHSNTGDSPSTIQPTLPSSQPQSTPGSESSRDSNTSSIPAAPVSSAPATSKANTDSVQGTSDATEWRRLQSEPTLSGLDQFIAHYPSSTFRTQAESKREELAWNRAQEFGTAASLAEYLGRYPSGRYADRARDGVLRLDQKTIDGATDLGQLDPLLLKYPAGDMHARVVTKMDDLSWSQASRDPARAAEYLRSFPTGRHAGEARLLTSRNTNAGSTPPPVSASKSSPPPAESGSEHQGGDDKTLIQTALSIYEQAYNRQDVGAIERVWPTIPGRMKKNMEDSFKKMKSTHLTNEVLSETISGNSATLKLSQTIAFSTGGPLQSKSDKVTMELHKGGSGSGSNFWYIDSIH